MSYIVLRGRWCDIFILNMHTTTEDEKHYTKDSFCLEIIAGVLPLS